MNVLRIIFIISIFSAHISQSVNIESPGKNSVEDPGGG